MTAPSRIIARSIYSIYLTGEDATYQVVGCTIPRKSGEHLGAQVVVALGYSMLDRAVKIFTGSVGTDKVWRIILRCGTASTSKEVTLFEGLLIGQGGITVPSGYGGARQLTLTLANRSVRMARIGMDNFKYWNTKSMYAVNAPGSYALMPNDLMFRDSLSFVQAAMAKMPDVTQYTLPGVWMPAYADFLTAVTTAELAPAKYVEMFKADRDTHITGDIATNILRTTSLAQSVATRYRERWTQGTSWDMFTDMLTFMQLGYVPWGHGYRINSSVPWMKQAALTLGPDSILSVNYSLSDPLNPPLEAVAVALSEQSAGTASSLYATWPPLFADTAQLRGLGAAGALAVATMPTWLSDIFYSELTGRKITDKDASGKKVATGTAVPQATKAVREMTVGEAFAKAYWAQMKNKTMTMAVKVPWHRIDLADYVGEVLELDMGPVAGATGKLFGNMYGQLTGWTFVAESRPESGSSAQIQLDIAYVRDENMNNEYGLAAGEEPLYQGGSVSAPSDAFSAVL